MTTNNAAGRVVVVGASLAGARAAESLRAKGFTGDLTIIGDEPHAPYDRPPLSKAVLSGALRSDHLDLPYADGIDAEWLLGIAARRLDPATREVVLDDGRRVGFDRLVVATGTRARPWPHRGQASLDHVHTLRGRDDADRLQATLAAGARRVLVIGGGFTGSEVASSCRHLGLDVTMALRGSTPMQSALGAVVGGAIARVQLAHGVDLRPNTTVVELLGERSGSLRAARLSDGSVLEVDVAVVTTGSLRNVEWLAGSGLAVDRGGLRCDAACRAMTVTGQVSGMVYAAGDVACWSHPLFDNGPLSFEHWGNAVDQADTVAHNIMCRAGDERVNTALPAFWSDQFGLNIKSVGLLAGADEVALTQGCFDGDSFVAVYGSKGRTVGAVAVNLPRVLDGYADLIRQRVAFPPVLDAVDGPDLITPEPAGFTARAAVNA